MVKLYKVTVGFIPESPVLFAKWHGLFLNALITRALSGNGINIDHRARKHLYITPIMDREEELTK
ncbi:hypothetical protein [Caldivirga maquilingensis]|uniref:hypothetical protein n=1 Tax=Caldivirga maquilingensis TaxID=76887 RepID=UPI00064FDC9B|nr:hypothetical protein [Caldivirga maquilingensis]